MEKLLPNGKEMADEDRRDHQKVKEQLYKFQSLKATDAEFEPTIRTLFKDLSVHMKEEEENHMVVLEQALSKEDSEKMHKSFQRSKMFAPTRSHPSAPDKPPFENVAGLLAAPIDKLRDMFSKFPDPKDL